MRSIETKNVLVGTEESDEKLQGKLLMMELDGGFYLSLSTIRVKTTLEKAGSAAWPAAKIAGRFALTAVKAALGIRDSSASRMFMVKGTTEDWEKVKKSWNDDLAQRTLVSVIFCPDEVSFDTIEGDAGVMNIVKKENGKEKHFVVTPACGGGEEKRILGQWKAFIEGRD